MLESGSDEPSVSRLRGLEFELDSRGTATPVAIIDPVAIGGSTVTRVSLRNAAFLRDHDVRLGDALTVRSAGAVPFVDAMLPLLRTGHGEALRIPNNCPVCDCDLRHIGDEIVCPNAACPPQLSTRIRRLVAPDAFNIPELDGESIDDLIEAQVLQTPADVFRLREELLVRRGWTADRAAALTASVERAKKISLERLLIATTGIDHTAAASIAAHARSLARVKRLAAGSLARLPDVGTRTAEAVANFMREPRNRKMLAQIARAGVTTLRVFVHQEH